MNGRHCVCHSCGRRVEFDSKDVPCEVLRGWLIVSHLKGVEEVDRRSFCSPSCLKRWADVKDSASLLPEFGGGLDMLDGVLVAAPVAAVCLYGG